MSLNPAPLIEVDYTPGEVLTSAGPWTPLLWDMDGTLLDSQVAIIRRLRETFLHYDITPPDDDQLRLLIGPPVGQSLAKYIGPEHLDESRAFYRSLSERDGLKDQQLFPWILATVTTLHEAGIPMAVATSKPQHEAERICEAFGLDPFITAIVGSDETRPEKSQVIAECVRQLGTTNALMIGDRFYDTEGAALNGIPTVLVRWGYADEKEFAGAMATVSSSEELLALLLEQNK